MKKRLYVSLALILLLLVAAGVTAAAFGDKGEILGSSFSIGSADIKFLIDLAGGTSVDNLVDELSGPNFADISPNWSQDYTLKIYNNTNSSLQLTSNADYETANDPDELRQIIFVEFFDWGDLNNDGSVEEDELGVSHGRKTIVKWKTEGFDLGPINPGGAKGLVLRFSTESISDTKQGKSAIFDFIFDSLSLE